MAKKRIVLSLEGTPKTEQIVWYKGTAQKDILNSIREVSYRATLLLYFEVLLDVNRLARSKQYLLLLVLFCLFEERCCSLHPSMSLFIDQVPFYFSFQAR